MMEQDSLQASDRSSINKSVNVDARELRRMPSQPVGDDGDKSSEKHKIDKFRKGWKNKKKERVTKLGSIAVILAVGGFLGFTCLFLLAPSRSK